MRFLPLAVVTAIAGCQEQYGECPAVDAVDPFEASPGETVTIRGSGFELAHRDLLDEASASPPSVWLTFKENPLMPEEMQSLSMELGADLVVFESAEQIQAILPSLDWSDIETAAQMVGVELPDTSLLPDVIPVPTALHVENPSGCSGEWEGDFVLDVRVREPQEEG